MPMNFVLYQTVWPEEQKSGNFTSSMKEIWSRYCYHDNIMVITMCQYLCNVSCTSDSRGNKCRFWQIFVEALEEFPIVIIQSRNSASTHEYSENCHASIAQLN